MQFGLDIIALVEELPKTITGRAIGRQLIRCGTSVGANYRAACRGKSVPDMVAKLAIVEEEADESAYWLEMIVAAKLLPLTRVDGLLKEANEIVAMTVASRQKNDDKVMEQSELIENRKSKIENPYCRIINTPIDTRALESRVAGTINGAVLTFLGQVRNRSRGREVAYLEYDAYVPMAEKMLVKIAAEARGRWGVEVAIEHRIGRIELGEPSVAVCVGSPHRSEAFEACRYCIDTLKETVPIWKKEVCPDGAFWIEGEDAVKAER